MRFDRIRDPLEVSFRGAKLSTSTLLQGYAGASEKAIIGPPTMGRERLRDLHETITSFPNPYFSDLHSNEFQYCPHWISSYSVSCGEISGYRTSKIQLAGIDLADVDRFWVRRLLNEGVMERPAATHFTLFDYRAD